MAWPDGGTTGRKASNLVGFTANVLEYGAVSGADSTTAFQGAIDAVATAGGGTVWVPTGTYLLTQIKMKSQVRLQGAGIGSILKSKTSNANAYMIVLDAISVTDTALSQLQLDGNKANQTTNGLILYDQTAQGSGDWRHRFDHLWVRQAKNDGIHLKGDCRSGTMTNVYVGGCDGNGLVFEDGGCTDWRTVNCRVGGNGLAGITDAGTGNQFVNVTTDLNGQITGTSGVGFKLTGLAAKLSNCSSQLNVNTGLLVSGNGRHDIRGHTCDTNGTGTAGDAFRFDGASDCVLEGHVLDTRGTTPTHRNIVSFVNSSTRNHVDVTYVASGLNAGGSAVNGTSSSSAYCVRVLGAAPTFTVT